MTDNCICKRFVSEGENGINRTNLPKPVEPDYENVVNATDNTGSTLPITQEGENK